MPLADIDTDKPDALKKFESQIDWLRKNGVKEFTDQSGRKIVLDLGHKPGKKAAP